MPKKRVKITDSYEISLYRCSRYELIDFIHNAILIAEFSRRVTVHVHAHPLSSYHLKLLFFLLAILSRYLTQPLKQFSRP